MKHAPRFLILAIATVIGLVGCGKNVETVCKKINDVSKTKPIESCVGKLTALKKASPPGFDCAAGCAEL